MTLGRAAKVKMNSRNFVTFALALVVTFSATSMSFAADPQHGAEHADQAEKPALLQWDLGSAFWSIVVFVMLLTVLRFTAWRPIMEGLQKREQFIRESLESAKREREQAERVMADYTEKLNRAREEATAIVDEGRRDAEEVRKRIHVEAKQEADAMVARARKEISLARDHAVKDIYDQTIVLATSVAGKIVRKELSAGDHRTLIDESLAEIGRLNN